jgi:hypothetical protein
MTVFFLYRVEKSKSEISLNPAVEAATVALFHHFVKACILFSSLGHPE